MVGMPSPDVFYAPNRVGNRFGKPGGLYGQRGHLGLDHRWGSGTDIPAWFEEGVVRNVPSSPSPTLGWNVRIEVTKGDGRGLYMWPCHMRSKTRLRLGQVVRYGDTLGQVGSTGSLSTGPHLHTAMSRDTSLGYAPSAVDPLPYIERSIKRLSPAGEIGNPIDMPLNTKDFELIWDRTALTNRLTGNKASPAALLELSRRDAHNTAMILGALVDGRLDEKQRGAIPAKLDEILTAVKAIKPATLTLTDSQLAAIADRIAEQISIPSASEIAKAVNEDAARRLQA